MKTKVIISLFAVAGMAQAVVIVDTTYNVNTSLGDTTQYFLESTDATWTIGAGVTVSGGRYFIGSGGAPENDDVPAIFTVDGGGTLDLTRNGIYNLRLGQDNTSEAGILIIKGGSAVNLSGATAGAFAQQTGSYMELNGLGSTFRSVGSWNALTSQFTSQTGVAGGTPITVNVAGGVGYTIEATTSGAFTTITVVPEPNAAVLGGLGVLALLRRRRA
jgi:hypothetical protein